MPLKLTLKAHEKVLIGTAVVVNGGTKAELIVLNTVPVLRERDVLTEDEANTPARRVYYTVLNMYANPGHEAEYHKIYFKLIRDFIDAVPNAKVLSLIAEMSQRILEGNHYQALKECRKLIDYETEVLTNAQ
ncbi:MAG: flagellar biosynthesis repressor FlbT [Alphaproteobacteria bacterium RIFOXYD12_FULL_60_8]|nr:MAG: flagellar biosynthesis repressor FlbT [Alphaproteobacteria bacterium RIFOXYD12_FULL_60_8]